MVGAAREEQVAQPALPIDSLVISPIPAAAAAILPRRILFHPPLKAMPASSHALTLTPLNLHTPFSSCSSVAAAVEDPLLEKASRCFITPLPTMQIQRIGAGLNNLGNTCFLNAVLQCLTYTPPLAAYFQAGRHQSSCRSVGFCAMCALERHVKQALSAGGRVISPNQLVKNLRCISRSFHMGRQEDAHEYMRYLIEALQKSCPLEAHVNAESGLHRNFIQRIFGGQLCSQVKCTQCAHSSNTFDPFLDLSLDIVKAESLLKALARFTAIEVLDGDNKYHCSKCKAKVRAHKQFTINNAPHVLTVQFKRFSSSRGCGGKIDKRVQFDRSLDLIPFVNGGKEGDLRYSLYAVLVHSGWSTHSGHYFCFVRTSTDMWHRLDDNRVSQVSEKSVLEQKAYILFYIRETEGLLTSNGNRHGIRSDRYTLPNGTSDKSQIPKANGISNHKDTSQLTENLFATSNHIGNGHINYNGTSEKAQAPKANGMSNHKDTAQMRGNPFAGRNHIGNGHINHNAARSKESNFSNTITNNDSSNKPGIPNRFEVNTNRNMVRVPPANSTPITSPPSPVEVLCNEFPSKAAANSFSSSNKGMGSNNADKGSNNGHDQMNGDLKGSCIGSHDKTCTPAPAEVELHLANGIGLSDNSKKMKRSEVPHHPVNGNGSMKRICLDNVKEFGAKGNMPQRLDRQAVFVDHSTKDVLLSKDKAICDKPTTGWQRTCSVLPLSSSEMAVPRWEDEDESKGNTTVEHLKPSAEKVAQCGHVLDEWDKEYDRGKKKKVRNRKDDMEGISEVSLNKKRKKVPPFSLEDTHTASTNNEEGHGNVFQAFAGSKGQGGPRLKKSRKRQRDFGHKLFLKRHRFRQLHANSLHRRKR